MRSRYAFIEPGRLVDIVEAIDVKDQEGSDPEVQNWNAPCITS